jgi:hypothetical protein
MNYQDTIIAIDKVFKKYDIQSEYNNKICGYIIRTKNILAYLLFNLNEKNEIDLDFDVIQGNKKDLKFYEDIKLSLCRGLSGRKRKLNEI